MVSGWLAPGRTAVITGGASGIGYATAARLADAGMQVLLADIREPELFASRDRLRAAGARVEAQVCDVRDLPQVEALRDRALSAFGGVHFLMNNAGASLRVRAPWLDLDKARQVMEINLWGVMHGCAAFLPAMLEAGEPAAVVNTGSKQGLTRPPGNYGYNLSKAGVLVYTEAVAHALRKQDSPITAHLLIPGFVYTDMIRRVIPDKPAGAWTPEQTVDFLMARLEDGDFYILCPDNETPRSLDDKRIQWTADDLIHNRPALSRWHPDFADAFRDYVREP